MLIRILLLSLLLLSATACSMFESKQEPSKSGDYSYLLDSQKGKVVDDSKRTLESFDTTEEAHGKAQKAWREGDRDRALFYYVKALEIDDKDAKALFAIARIHAERNNLVLSSKAYDMGLALSPEDVDGLEGAGIVQLRMNRYDRAEASLGSAVALDPKRPRALSALAVIADMRQDYGKALRLYEKAITIAPSNISIMNNYAYSRYLAGKWQDAEKIFVRILKRHPRHYQASLNLGLLKARQGKSSEALASFRRVLKEAEAYNELGYIYMLDGKYDEAHELFRRAMAASAVYFKKAADNLDKLNLLRAQAADKRAEAAELPPPAWLPQAPATRLQ